MAVFAASFLQYLIIFIVLVAVAIGGIFLGKTLRIHKDAKNAEVNLQKKE